MTQIFIQPKIQSRRLKILLIESLDKFGVFGCISSPVHHVLLTHQNWIVNFSCLQYSHHLYCQYYWSVLSPESVWSLQSVWTVESSDTLAGLVTPASLVTPVTLNFHQDESKHKDKVLQRLNVCHIFEKAGVLQILNMALAIISMPGTFLNLVKTS